MEKLKSELGDKVEYFVADLTDGESINKLVKDVEEKFGRIDIVINNAGTGAVAPAEDITDDQFNGELNVDLGGTFKVARAGLDESVRRKLEFPHVHSAGLDAKRSRLLQHNRTIVANAYALPLLHQVVVVATALRGGQRVGVEEYLGYLRTSGAGAVAAVGAAKVCDASAAAAVSR